MYANSHQFENHCCKSQILIIICRGIACMHAQIQKSMKGGYSTGVLGGMLQNILRFSYHKITSGAI